MSFVHLELDNIFCTDIKLDWINSRIVAFEQGGANTRPVALIQSSAKALLIVTRWSAEGCFQWEGFDLIL